MDCRHALVYAEASVDLDCPILEDPDGRPHEHRVRICLHCGERADRTAWLHELEQDLRERSRLPAIKLSPAELDGGASDRIGERRARKRR